MTLALIDIAFQLRLILLQRSQRMSSSIVGRRPTPVKAPRVGLNFVSERTQIAGAELTEECYAAMV